MSRALTLSPRRHVAGLLACLIALAAPAAHAVLGGDAATIQEDQIHMQGQRRQAQALPLQVQSHVITLADGSSVREYVSPSGIVFAVAWSTHFKPRLEMLLGQHAAGYTAAAHEASKKPGIQRHVRLTHGDLVVLSTAHLNAFVGKAYLRSLVPAGVNVDELR